MEVQQQNIIKMVVGKLRSQIVLTKVHLDEQLLAGVRAAKQCDHKFGTWPTTQGTEHVVDDVGVHERGGRGKIWTRERQQPAAD